MSRFDTFQNRWQITATLTLVTPLRIGGGQNAGAYSMSQTPVLLSYNAQSKTAEPYIPGSSLKGVLRSTVERMVRTFNENESCMGVGDRKAGKVLCGSMTCISCSIFGSQNTGASIRVQDAHVSNDAGNLGMLEERPHCATKYRINNNTEEYEVITDNKGKPKSTPRFEEVIAANTSFNLAVNLDNATETDVGLIVLALNEFNHKRCYLGGGASRGYGFADVDRLRVTRRTVADDEDFLFNVDSEQIDPYQFCDAARRYLAKINDGKEVSRRDFDVYYKAYSNDRLEGNIVVKYDVETLTDFQMPGIDEATVTNMGVPVIPGSTIKGFLRHTLIESGTSSGVIDDMFGSKNTHRSRVIVSDAFSMDDFAGRDVIPQGTHLSMWIAFDNVTKEQLLQISDIMESKCRITGKRVANVDRSGNASKNMVEFEATEVQKFQIEEFLAE
ncbi:MAG: CRISPR-associated protein Csm3 [Methanolobus sp.]|jgi:CRISPR-associated protein Csm3|nr:CRISPR-associated protein Csm3 [Methanolobus sp.]MDK2911877.1 CRISPR-associated protein Csm3 [Methanolobus sp.]MDN5310566.1 CRISPR-associated protein Csm3 [Methanolobus sp.]